jgi:hypothetical protein
VGESGRSFRVCQRAVASVPVRVVYASRGVRPPSRQTPVSFQARLACPHTYTHIHVQERAHTHSRTLAHTHSRTCTGGRGEEKERVGRSAGVEKSARLFGPHAAGRASGCATCGEPSSRGGALEACGRRLASHTCARRPAWARPPHTPQAHLDTHQRVATWGCVLTHRFPAPSPPPPRLHSFRWSSFFLAPLALSLILSPARALLLQRLSVYPVHPPHPLHPLYLMGRSWLLGQAWSGKPSLCVMPSQQSMQRLRHTCETTCHTNRQTTARGQRSFSRDLEKAATRPPPVLRNPRTQKKLKPKAGHGRAIGFWFQDFFGFSGP